MGTREGIYDSKVNANESSKKSPLSMLQVLEASAGFSHFLLAQPHEVGIVLSTDRKRRLV